MDLRATLSYLRVMGCLNLRAFLYKNSFDDFLNFDAIKCRKDAWVKEI